MSFPKSFHLHIQHWVVWWFYIGIVCGVIAVTNIVFRHLSETQTELVLVFGVLHWVLGGVICYCIDGVKIVPPERPSQAANVSAAPDAEWHCASDFLLPGNRQSILPNAYWRSRLTRGAAHLPASGFPYDKS